MSLMQHYHTETALTNTTTDTQWQLVVEQLLMEEQFLAIFLALKLKLTEQTLLVDTDTHRTQFKAATENRIPDKDITVQASLAILSYR